MFSHTEPSRPWEKDKLSNAPKTARQAVWDDPQQHKGKDILEARHEGEREEVVVQGKRKGKGKGGGGDSKTCEGSRACVLFLLAVCEYSPCGGVCVG